MNPLGTSFAVFAVLGAWDVADAASLLFTDVEADGVGRVEIQVDQTPADIGAADFTLEFWMRSSAGNTRPEVGCNTPGYNWIEGNILFDRDRLGASARDFGLAIAGGRIVFGVENSNGSYTICSASNVLDGQWRHVAVQRRAADGRLWLHVDGVLERQDDGPDGDISYPDGQQSDPREPLLVIGREKYDFGPPGYRGWIDEIRLSSSLRYPSGNFQVRTEPFELDANTVALYHLDDGTGDAVMDDNGNLSPGVRRYSAAAGPEWSTQTRFVAGGSPGTLRFSTSSYAASEGVAALAITVTRTGGSSGGASVSVDVSGGTAMLNADYQIPATPLMWNDGDSSARTFNITMIDDALVEGNETINLALSNATGASLGSPAASVVTIADDDGQAPPPGGGGSAPRSSGGGALTEFWVWVGLCAAIRQRSRLRIAGSSIPNRRIRFRDRRSLYVRSASAFQVLLSRSA